MRRFRSRRRPPFVALPRHRRRDEVIRLMGRMRRNAAEYGGRFTSHLVLNEPDRPDIFNQWFRFCFLGTDRFTFWNATIWTASKAFWDKTHEQAFDRAWALLSDEERRDESRLEFVPSTRSRTGKILTYELVRHEEKRYAQFGGLTFDEYVRIQETEIINKEPPAILESFRVDRHYVYGIGLNIVLDVDAIDQRAIEMAIDRFLAVGETDWESPDPVPRDRLPTVTQMEALAQAQYPSVYLGRAVRSDP